MATAKIKEHGLENKIERIDQSTTTYFDITTKVWGSEPSRKSISVQLEIFSFNLECIFYVKAYLLSSWELIEPGDYQYPFALKVNKAKDTFWLTQAYLYMQNPGLCSSPM